MARPRGCVTEATKTTIEDLWSTHGAVICELVGIAGCVIGSVVTNKVYDWCKSKKENKK